MSRAVLLDAFGTLVRLEPPVAPLARALGLPAAQVAPALRAEMRFYRANLHEGGTREGLARLRRRCAGVLREALGVDTPVDEVQRALLDALRFSPFADAAPALRAWRDGGAAIVVLSNWDLTLHEVLGSTGLAPLVDHVITSAEAGIAKPHPEAFRRALARAGATTGLHVGDDPEADARGARDAGLDALLLVRDGGPAAPPGVAAVGSLLDAVEHWRST